MQDSTLIKDVNVFQGLKEGGIAIVNTEKAIAHPIPKGVKVISIDAPQRQIRSGIGAYHLCIEFPPVYHAYQYAVGALNDMVVRNYKAIFADDKTGARTRARDRRALATGEIEKSAQVFGDLLHVGMGLVGHFCPLLNNDFHHGG